VEAVNVREIRRTYDRAVKIPKALVEELARVTTAAQPVWRDARREDDFLAFRPHLKKIVALKRKQADAIGYEREPYDALLDEYEPGVSAAAVTAVFDALRPGLVELVGEIASGRQSSATSWSRTIRSIARPFASASAAVGFAFDAGRLDVTAHPFCGTIGRAIAGSRRGTTRRASTRRSSCCTSRATACTSGARPEHAGTPRAWHCRWAFTSRSRGWGNRWAAAAVRER
jgi:carboxypeptidase Taq